MPSRRLERSQCSGGGGDSESRGSGIVAGNRRYRRIEQGMIELWHLTATHDLEAVW
jgi:hypothetical protein